MSVVRPVIALVLGTAIAGGCNKEPEGEAPATPARGSTPAAETAPKPTTSATAIEGTVEGLPLEIESAIFMWRDGADDMQIMLSNTAGLCSVMTDGAWQRGATMLYATLKHTSRRNRDAPFSAGEFPVRSGRAIEPRDTKFAQFARFDDRCKPSVKARATAGSFQLTTETVSLEGVAEGTFDLTFGNDKLAGHFTAKFCPPPEDEPTGCR